MGRCIVTDNALTTLAAAFTAGVSTSFAVLAGKGGLFGAPTSTNPVRVTCIKASALNAAGQLTDDTKRTTFLATGRAGDVLSGVTYESGNATLSFAVGDTIGDLWTAEHVAERDDALTAVEASVAANTTALAAKAPLASPVLTGTVTAPLVVGGATAAADITVKGTSHATPGRVLLNGTVTGVDANGRIFAGGTPNILIPTTIKCVVSDASDAYFGAAVGAKIVWIEMFGGIGFLAARDYQAGAVLPIVLGQGASVAVGQDNAHRWWVASGNTVQINPDDWLSPAAPPFIINGCTTQTAPLLVMQQRTTGTPSLQPCATYDAAWATSTQGSQKGRAVVSACDASGTNREGLRVESDGTQALVSLGAGTPFKKILSAVAPLDFPSVTAGGQQELTISVTGATAGDSVALSRPAALEAGLVVTARVTAADTVTVRASNITGSAIDPASGTYRATVTRF